MIGNYRSDIMKNVITSVMPDSIAEEVGIEENDILYYRILKGNNLHHTKIELPCSGCGEWFTGTFNYIIRLHGRRCNNCIMKDIIKKTNTYIFSICPI